MMPKNVTTLILWLPLPEGPSLSVSVITDMEHKHASRIKNGKCHPQGD